MVFVKTQQNDKYTVAVDGVMVAQVRRIHTDEIVKEFRGYNSEQEAVEYMDEN